jgi:sec-independent protein translocase protein TatC
MNEELPQSSALEHLLDLKLRLTYSVIAWLAATIVCYIFIADILHFLMQPLAEAYDDPQEKRLIFTSLPEAFVAYIKLSMIAGFFIAFPAIAFQLYRFIAPALYAREKRAMLPFIISAPLLFYSGAALAYYYIFPAAWQFFVSFELPSSAAAMPIQLEAKLSEYLGLITSIVLAFGISFQLPLVLLLLIKAKIIEVEMLKKARRYAIVGLLIVSAVLTPPDIISQIGLFIPLYGLYEIAIFAARFIR